METINEESHEKINETKTQTSAMRAVTLFGTFHLGEAEFTLPVECIQEVVNLPARLTPMPLAPAYLLGVFNLRGTIIPVIGMRRLLRQADAVSSAGHKVAIIDFEGAKVGLLFDSTGEILHVQEEQRSEFRYDASAEHRAVKGALRLEDGDRIVQILDPESLLHIENLPQIIDRISKKNPRQDREAHARGARRQCISFRAGPVRLALDINGINEIIRLPELQASVTNDRNGLGMANLRGKTIPVIDFVAMLGYRAEHPRDAAEERIIVLRDGHAAVGLLIDCVHDIASFYGDEVLPVPLFNGARAGMFEGLISREGIEDRILLSAEGTWSNPEVGAVAESHAKLFGNGGADAEARKRSASQRRVCIAFQLERAFGLPIGDIQEIISASDRIIRPPGMPDEIRGILNLRGQAVTIVDLRALYGMLPFADHSRAKVLIVQGGGEKSGRAQYGLLVDTVEDIVSYFEDQKLALPKSLFRGDDRQGPDNEVREILELPPRPDSGSDLRRSLMILDLEKLVARIELAIDRVA